MTYFNHGAHFKISSRNTWQNDLQQPEKPSRVDGTQHLKVLALLEEQTDLCFPEAHGINNREPILHNIQLYMIHASLAYPGR